MAKIYRIGDFLAKMKTIVSTSVKSTSFTGFSPNWESVVLLPNRGRFSRTRLGHF